MFVIKRKDGSFFACYEIVDNFFVPKFVQLTEPVQIAIFPKDDELLDQAKKQLEDLEHEVFIVKVTFDILLFED